ncbi:MAG: hypothetical protein LQ351_007876 [Letrouitia transgressa]|nr:MAG: hypothetical protein LQ351_007876 [Letrouitia transgressa]
MAAEAQFRRVRNLPSQPLYPSFENTSSATAKMHFLRSKLVALLVTAFAHADGHLIMKTPVPYGADHLDSNPLLPDGSDFPCKQRSNVYKLIKQNIMQVGQNQSLSFQGQATHGGGACQISLTTDKQPTKQSVWKVILTIEGGCPSTYPGNVGDDPFGYGADQFHFAIPPSVPPGDYTLAWTWFNKIGDREMYMNCAPIRVTGASQKRRVGDKPTLDDGEVIQKRALSSLPDMFVANIGNGCSTPPSGSTLAIPQQNLGTVVQHFGSDALTPPIGNCAQSLAKPPTQAGPQASAQTPNAETPAAPPPFALPPLDSPKSAPTPLAAPPPPPLPSITQPQPSAAPPVDPRPSAPQSNSSSGNIQGLSSGPCPTPGKSVCSPDGKGIGTCDQFNRVIYIPVPPGTKCDKTLGVEVHARRRRMIRSTHGKRRMI